MKINKKMAVRLMFSFLFLFLYLMPVKKLCAGAVVNIYVVKSRDIKPYNESLEGFIKVLNKNGYKEGKNLVLKYYLLEEMSSFFNQIEKKEPDLIFSIGTEATQKIRQQGINDIPVVFSMVLNTDEYGFRGSNQNITGSSLDITPDDQFKAIKAVITNVKKTGVVHCNESYDKAVKKAFDSAKKVGLELIAIKINSAKEVPKAIEEIMLNAEVLWTIPDTEIFNEKSLEYIIPLMLKRKIPLFGYADLLVRKGALLALGCDYEDIGRQAGDLSLKILQGEKPENLSITYPDKTRLFLNAKVAEQIGIEIPLSILDKAYKIYQ